VSGHNPLDAIACAGTSCATLDQDVENKPSWFTARQSECFVLAMGNDDLIRVPFVVAVGCAPTDAIGEFPAEFRAPLPDLARIQRGWGCPQFIEPYNFPLALLERFPFALAHGPRSNALLDRVIHRFGDAASADNARAHAAHPVRRN
jgi:hypothetical protein